MCLLKELFYGAVFGVANIIPGVSGGTMALVLGFYERLVAAIHHISPSTFLIFLKALRCSRESFEVLQRELARIDAWFLIKLAVGALAAIVVLAKAMTYLLVEWHDPTYGFFFGLVLVSAVSPYRLIERKSLSVLAAVIIGASAVWGIGATVSDESLVEKAQIASEMKRQKQTESKDAADIAGSFGKKRTLPFYIGFFTMGAVAISGMILPGVSGSFLLLLMGGYFDILTAIVERDLFLLASFAGGCLVGILLFTRLLNYLLTAFRDHTLGALLGLVIGSLWAIWPFKRTAVVGGETTYLSNRIPESFGSMEWMTLLTAVVGMVIVYLFIRLERR